MTGRLNRASRRRIQQAGKSGLLNFFETLKAFAKAAISLLDVCNEVFGLSNFALG